MQYTLTLHAVYSSRLLLQLVIQHGTMPVIIYLLRHPDCNTVVQIHKSDLGGELLVVEIVFYFH